MHLSGMTTAIKGMIAEDKTAENSATFESASAGAIVGLQEARLQVLFWEM